MEVLEHMKFKTMTPIQAKAIPALLSGKDVLGAAKYPPFPAFTLEPVQARLLPLSSLPSNSFLV